MIVRAASRLALMALVLPLAPLAGCNTPERLLQKTHDLRLAGQPEAAAISLERTLRARDAREKPLAPADAARLTEEVAAAARFISMSVNGALAGRLPLAAEHEYRKYARLLAHDELARTRGELRAAIDQSGRESCAQLSAGRERALAPYWTYALDRYCAHWGVRSSTPVELPDLVSSVTVGGQFDGATAEDMEELRALVAESFARSAWYDQRTVRTAGAKIAGAERAEFARYPRTLTVPWTEQVPYTATESYQQPYTESHLATETYSVQVPYSSSESYSYSCGSGRSYRSCTGTRSVTRSRSESRTRLVTRTRTAWRLAFRTVTRYRPVSREFTYQAIEYTGAYSGELTLTLRLPTVSPIVVRQSGTLSRSGLFHDVEFAPAGITASRPRLPSRTQWVEAQLEQLQDRLAAALRQHWQDTFCSAAQYTLDEAARCAYASAEALPEPARRAFEGAFGRDTSRLLALLEAAAP